MRTLLNNPTYAQVRSLLLRWGYAPVDPKDADHYARKIQEKFPECLWGKDDRIFFLPFGDAPVFDEYVMQICEILGNIHSMQTFDVYRIMLAEPGELRNYGSIQIEPQPLTDWGDREDHAPAEIRLDNRGRNQLIAALIEGRDSITVAGSSGGGYDLALKYIKNSPIAPRIAELCP